jgi:hypothetical protein
MTNDENRTATLRALISAFVFRHSFDIRHSDFVIFTAGSLAVCWLGMTNSRPRITLVGLIIQFTKRKNGGALLRCVRADGSTTWQRQDDNRAAFFPLHDLTHYAVETELGFSHGFYGLIADGWDIANTIGKSARGPLPDEAIEVEYIVGSLGAERAGDSSCTAEEFNQLAATFAKTTGLPEPRQLTDGDLTSVRSRIAELCAQWRNLEPGATLELAFPL